MIAIDAKTGRTAGESEPDYDAIVKEVTQDMTVSQIQRKFLLMHNDAVEVKLRFDEVK